MDILGERATETSGSRRGWGWGGISGSGCYSLRERGTETTSGCLVEGVCFFILAYLLCFVLFCFFSLNTFTIILLKGSYDLVRWIDFFDTIDTQDW